MTTSEVIRCNAIIHTASLAAAGVGAGLAQIPGSDNAIITPIQLSMVTMLGRVFDVSVTKSSAEAAIASAAAATVGRTASQILAGWVPGYGNVMNAVTAATLTEGVGWLIAEQFAEAS